MNGAEYRATIDRLGLSGPQVAELFDYTRQIHYSTWSKGGPPQSVAMWLRFMLATGFTAQQLERYKTGELA